MIFVIFCKSSVFHMFLYDLCTHHQTLYFYIIVALIIVSIFVWFCMIFAKLSKSLQIHRVFVMLRQFIIFPYDLAALHNFVYVFIWFAKSKICNQVAIQGPRAGSTSRAVIRPSRRASIQAYTQGSAAGPRAGRASKRPSRTLVQGLHPGFARGPWCRPCMQALIQALAQGSQPRRPAYLAQYSHPSMRECPRAERGSSLPSRY